MDVRIDELHSTIDAVDGSALLSPETLDHIVRAVMRALATDQEARATVRSELDLRSIVEQQRRTQE